MTTIQARPNDLVENLTRYCRSKLRDAATYSEPYPYLTLDKFLPTGMMQQINAHYPTLEQMGAMPGSRTGNPYAHQHRRLLTLKSNEIDAMPVKQAEFWRFFYAFMQRMGPKLLKVLPAAPSDQQCVAAKKEEIKTRIDLWCDRGGYQITPHTDAPHKLATFLLYCSDNPALEAEGTSVFEPKNKELRCWTGKQWPLEDFNEVYRAPYGCNRLFGFRKTDLSFHGKLPVAESTNDRRTIAITVQTREGFVP